METIHFRVVDQNNLRIKGAEIILNYQKTGITDSSGILTVDNVTREKTSKWQL